MLASVIVVAVAIGLTGEEQAALDALIASRQAARAARLEAEATEREARMLVFYAKQSYEARDRRESRQARLLAAKSYGRPHIPTSNMQAMQRLIVADALHRQLAPWEYRLLPSAGR